MNTTVTLTSRGYELDLNPSSFGELTRSDGIFHDTGALRKRLMDEGYLYLPGFFPREHVQEGRTEFLRRLEASGALNPSAPLDEALKGDGQPKWTHDAFRAGNEPMRAIVFDDRLMAFYTRLLGGESCHYDHIWTRAVAPGVGTSPHCDFPYMNRGTQNVMTAWIPYGDVPLEMGGLMMLEKSHQQEQRLRKYLEMDVDTYCENRGPYKFNNGLLSSNPVSLREKLGGRWLTNAFRMGDLLTFGMKTVHASLDNHTRSYRISTDTRYQLASEPVDPRWVGEGTEEYAEKNRVGKIC